MSENLAVRWRAAFWNTVRSDDIASRLRDAAVQGRLGDGRRP